jgi:hypothetical protein
MANITQACEAAGISRRVVYDWQEKDEGFSLLFNEANAIATEVLEAEAWRRGHDGIEKPVYQGGKRVGSIREHSDTLLIFLLKARAPEKYRDNVNVNHGGQIDLKLGAARKVLRVVGGTER